MLPRLLILARYLLTHLKIRSLEAKVAIDKRDRLSGTPPLDFAVQLPLLLFPYLAGPDAKGHIKRAHTYKAG